MTICRCCKEEITEDNQCSCGLDLCNGDCYKISDLWYFEFFDRREYGGYRTSQKTYRRVPMRFDPKRYFYREISVGDDLEITLCELAPEWMQKEQ